MSQLRKFAKISLSRVKFVEAISILQQEFNNRFQDFKRHSQYFQLLANPFNIDVEDIPVELQMEIIDLQPQDILKDSFKASPLLFFAELPASFSKIKNIAAKYFSMFGSNYVCEQAFSHMKKIKNPYRSRLTDDHLHHVLRASTSNFNVEIENIINNIQQQKSH
ncbi:general transcription factor II-I repeat domain-containing protein 2A-like [Rhopalosiphum padi]|uniref:general transcription factor II-I repeat domain-containing protein 2A-like n=1 Tax=Rhopalosiphum padi TaxID=40932 RepID=UPI00298D9B02|nr:general transcription factor II-I repeat domain-containing protein 2A-like [Rhopalosiphum padi]